MEDYVRKPNMFEKILLAVGIVAVIVGFGLIHKLISAQYFITYDAIISIFLWMILILLIVITAVSENAKEEIKDIVDKENQKLKLLRKTKL